MHTYTPRHTLHLYGTVHLQAITYNCTVLKQNIFCPHRKELGIWSKRNSYFLLQNYLCGFPISRYCTCIKTMSFEIKLLQRKGEGGGETGSLPVLQYACVLWEWQRREGDTDGIGERTVGPTGHFSCKLCPTRPGQNAVHRHPRGHGCSEPSTSEQPGAPHVPPPNLDY
jgi:hypothetical protein